MTRDFFQLVFLASMSFILLLPNRLSLMYVGFLHLLMHLNVFVVVSLYVRVVNFANSVYCFLPNCLTHGWLWGVSGRFSVETLFVGYMYISIEN